MFALRPHVDLRPHPTLLLPAAKKPAISSYKRRRANTLRGTTLIDAARSQLFCRDIYTSTHVHDLLIPAGHEKNGHPDDGENSVREYDCIHRHWSVLLHQPMPAVPLFRSRARFKACCRCVTPNPTLCRQLSFTAPVHRVYTICCYAESHDIRHFTGYPCSFSLFRLSYAHSAD